MVIQTAKHVPTPYHADQRDWRGRPSEHHWYIHGDRRECGPEDDDPDDEPETVCTAVAIVQGNATAGDIPRATAEFLCLAANHHHELVAMVGDLLRFCPPGELRLKAQDLLAWIEFRGILTPPG